MARCSHCGYADNPDDANRCRMCDASITPAFDTSRMDSSFVNRAATQQMNGPTLATEAPFIHHISPDNPGGNVCSQTAAAPVSQIGQESLEGKIRNVERNEERPPLTFYGVMGRVLIALLLLPPYIMLFIISGILCIAFAIVRFPTLSQLFNPFAWTIALIELLEVIVLRYISRTDTVPEYTGVLSDRNDVLYSFFMRGPLDGGALQVGHHVRFNGRWNRNIFIVRDGTDLTTQAAISSRYRDPWKYPFFAMLVLYAGLGISISMNFDQITLLYNNMRDFFHLALQTTPGAA